MAEWIGKIIPCSRCGQEIRLKYTGKEQRDGGYTEVLSFEKMPDDWGYHNETDWLCPSCEEDYRRNLKAFMRQF